MRGFGHDAISLSGPTVGFLMLRYSVVCTVKSSPFYIDFNELGDDASISCDLSSEPNIMIMGEVGFFTDPFFCEPLFIYVSRLSLLYCLVRSLQSGKGLTL